MLNLKAKVNFNGAEISLHEEHRTARNMMITKGTDLTLLYETVFHVYLNIPEEEESWSVQYLALLQEIQHRQNLLAGLTINGLPRK